MISTETGGSHEPSQASRRSTGKDRDYGGIGSAIPRLPHPPKSPANHWTDNRLPVRNQLVIVQLTGPIAPSSPDFTNCRSFKKKGSVELVEHRSKDLIRSPMRCDQPLRIGFVHRDRFFHQYMPAGFKRFNPNRSVGIVRGGDQHSVCLGSAAGVVPQSQTPPRTRIAASAPRSDHRPPSAHSGEFCRP